MSSWSTSPAAAASLRECVDICARDGGVPACPSSAAQNLQLALLAGNGTDHWIGVYQTPAGSAVISTLGTSNVDPAAGWDRCVSGPAPNFTALANPDDANGMPESCAPHHAARPLAGRAVGRVARRAVRAVRRPLVALPLQRGQRRRPLDGGRRCAHRAVRCGDGAQARRRRELVCDRHRRLALPPPRARRDGPQRAPRRAEPLRARRRRPSRGSESERRLAASMDAAALVRVRVSFALLAVGLLVFLFGLSPQLFSFLDTDLGPVVGSTAAWLSAFPIGLVMCMLSVSPQDTRRIRGLCVLFAVVFSVLSIVSAVANTIAFGGAGAFVIVVFAGTSVIMAVAAGILFFALRCRCGARGADETGSCFVVSPRAALQCLWLALRLFLLSAGLAAAAGLVVQIQDALRYGRGRFGHAGRPEFALVFRDLLHGQLHLRARADARQPRPRRPLARRPRQARRRAAARRRRRRALRRRRAVGDPRQGHLTLPDDPWSPG